MIFFQRWKKSPHEGFWIFIPFLGMFGRAKRKEKKSKIHFILSIFQSKFLFVLIICIVVMVELWFSIYFFCFILISYFLFNSCFHFCSRVFLRDLRFYCFYGQKITPDPWQDQTQKQLTSQLPNIHPRPIISIFRPSLSFHSWLSFNYSHFFVCFFLW